MPYLTVSISVHQGAALSPWDQFDGIKLLSLVFPSTAGITRTSTRLRRPALLILMSTSHHPLTEFAFLHLIPPTTLQSPQFITGFLTGIKAQPTWSGYPLHLFINQSQEEEPTGASENSTNKTTSIYIISGWTSVEAHDKWIASPLNQELMRSFAEANVINFGGLAHLDIDFTKLEFEECSQIMWRKKSVNDTVNWDDTSVWDKGQSGLEGGLDARVLWSYRGRAVDKDAEDEYELVGFSDGVLPAVNGNYTVLHKWVVEA